MAPLATTELTARVVLDATALGFAVSEVAIRLRSAANHRGATADHGSIVAVMAGLAAGLLSAVWCAVRVPVATIPGGWFPFVVGVVVMWLGVALRQWSVWTLGRFFTVVVRVAPGQTVVDRGPYRWVRHPSYAGLLLTGVGLGAALGNWLSVLVLVVLPSTGIALRIRVEERALLAGLGEPYREYARRHRRLVPGVW